MLAGRAFAQLKIRTADNKYWRCSIKIARPFQAEYAVPIHQREELYAKVVCAVVYLKVVRTSWAEPALKFDDNAHPAGPIHEGPRSDRSCLRAPVGNALSKWIVKHDRDLGDDDLVADSLTSSMALPPDNKLPFRIKAD